MFVTLFSDGSSRGNPGPGGFGTILRYVNSEGKVFETELTQGFKCTTNNRMELLGVISGLEALNRPCDVNVISDSKYVVDAFNLHWVDAWKKNNFKNGSVKNIDLWKRLFKAMEQHKVSFTWVKGHAGHPENERCDKMATTSADMDGLPEDDGFIPE